MCDAFEFMSIDPAWRTTDGVESETCVTEAAMVPIKAVLAEMEPLATVALAGSPSPINSSLRSGCSSSAALAVAPSFLALSMIAGSWLK